MKVDFFIVGAPKCGTTALAYYLSQHPSICLSNPKEPWFFATDLVNGQPGLPKTLKEYHEQCFSHRSSKHLLYGEASPMYMVSEAAIDNILEYNPHAKIIVMLRNPVDITYALHSSRFMAGPDREDICEFEKAWRVQESRKDGHNLPPNVVKPIGLQYRQVACIGSQLKRIMEKIERNNLLVIVNDDMRKKTEEIYDDTLRFLNLVQPENEIDFSPTNSNKNWKNMSLRKCYLMVSKLKRLIPFNLNTGLLSGIREFSMNNMKRAPLNEEFRAELVREFNSEVEILTELLQRDFSSWK